MSTVSYTIEATCFAIWSVLHKEYLPIPNEESWRKVANGFESKWNFPNCVGAIDGKHVRIQVICFFCFKTKLLYFQGEFATSS